MVTKLFVAGNTALAQNMHKVSTLEVGIRLVAALYPKDIQEGETLRVWACVHMGAAVYVWPAFSQSALLKTLAGMQGGLKKGFATMAFVCPKKTSKPLKPPM